MEVDRTFKNVSGMVAKIFEPKGSQRGYTYSFKVLEPEDALLPYLDPKYGSINISSLDDAPKYKEKQSIVIHNLGIKRNGKYTNAYILHDKEKVIQLDAVGTESCKCESVSISELNALEDKQAKYDGRDTDGGLLEFIVSLSGLKPADFDSLSWSEVMKAAINVRSLQK